MEAILWGQSPGQRAGWRTEDVHLWGRGVDSDIVCFPGCVLALWGNRQRDFGQYFGHLMWRTDSLDKALMLGKIEGRGWDGWMASLTRWTWVWVSSGSWWWTGKPGLLQSMGSQGVGHDWATELNWGKEAITRQGNQCQDERKTGVLWEHTSDSGHV